MISGTFSDWLTHRMHRISRHLRSLVMMTKGNPGTLRLSVAGSGLPVDESLVMVSIITSVHDFLVRNTEGPVGFRTYNGVHLKTGSESG